MQSFGSAERMPELSSIQVDKRLLEVSPGTTTLRFHRNNIELSKSRTIRRNRGHCRRVVPCMAQWWIVKDSKHGEICYSFYDSDTCRTICASSANQHPNCKFFLPPLSGNDHPCHYLSTNSSECNSLSAQFEAWVNAKK